MGKVTGGCGVVCAIQSLQTVSQQSSLRNRATQTAQIHSVLSLTLGLFVFLLLSSSLVDCCLDKAAVSSSSPLSRSSTYSDIRVIRGPDQLDHYRIDAT